MKKIIFVFTILMLFNNIICPPLVFSEENQKITQITEEQLNILDLSKVEKFTNQLDDEMKNYIPDFSLKNCLHNLINGNFDIDFTQIFNTTIKYLFKEIGVNLSLMGKLIVLSVFCAVLMNLHNAFEKGTIAKLAYAICFLVLITLVIDSFKITMQIGEDSIEKMVAFMQALMPVQLTLLAALGAFTSTAILHPFICVTLGALSTIFKVLIFPLILLGAVLGIVNNISDEFKVSRFSTLLNQATLFLLGLIFTLFVGVLSIQGVGGAVADGVSLRTAKYMTGAFIPVVGSMFSDALEAVVGGSLLLKNAVGILGVLVIIIISLFPALKIFAITIIYKVSAAIIQPLGNSKIADTLESISNSLLFVFASVATVALMFFLAIIIIVITANMTVMLR